MFAKLANIFRAPDLRKRVFYTLLMIVVMRLTAFVPIPFIDQNALNDFMRNLGTAGGIFSFVNMFTGGAFQNMTVGALGIMPYISASIIFQLLMVVWPRLEKIAKEGEAGRKKINQYTRYATVLLALFQGMGIATAFLIPSKLCAINSHFLFIAITAISTTAGTIFLMWIGEKVTERGIGNGSSIVITISVMSSFPGSIYQMVEALKGGTPPIWLPIVIALFLLCSLAIILIQEGTRRIPIQHARRVVGRRVTQAQTTYLPLKINSAGVIPVIFSSAILTFPGMLFGMVGGGRSSSGLMIWLENVLSMHSRANPYDLLNMESGGLALLLRSVNLWMFLYLGLTIFFCFFYTAIQFNPIDVAENLKKSGAFIPGKRPGRNTADYIDFVLTRITLVGAIFLCVIAALPYTLMISYPVLPSRVVFDFVGGTGLIITVGVVLDTMKQIESQLLMRHYEGFRPGARLGGWRGRAAA